MSPELKTLWDRLAELQKIQKICLTSLMDKKHIRGNRQLLLVNILEYTEYVHDITRLSESMNEISEISTRIRLLSLTEKNNKDCK